MPGKTPPSVTMEQHLPDCLTYYDGCNCDDATWEFVAELTFRAKRAEGGWDIATRACKRLLDEKNAALALADEWDKTPMESAYAVAYYTAAEDLRRVFADSWPAVAGEVMAPFYEAENTASQPSQAVTE